MKTLKIYMKGALEGGKSSYAHGLTGLILRKLLHY